LQKLALPSFWGWDHGMGSKSHFLTRLVLVVGLALTLLAVAPRRPASARPARTSPCHRSGGAEPAKRCVVQQTIMRREVRRKAVVDQVAARPLDKRRRVTLRHVTRRRPVLTAAAPAQSVDGPGWVSIESKPGNVRVYINGQPVGLTPLQVRLNEGRHTIEAIRGDGVRQRRIIDIEPGQQRFLVLVS
jgi:hypothetical protein